MKNSNNSRKNIPRRDKANSRLTNTPQKAKNTYQDSNYHNNYNDNYTKTKKSKAPFFVFAFFLLALTAVYLFGFIKYKSVFLPNTTVNMQDVSQKSALDTYEYYNSTVSNKKIEILNPDSTVSPKEEILFSDINYKENIELEKLENVLLNQDRYLWFLSFFKENEHLVDVNTSYDENLLKEKINNLSMLKDSNITKPENAYISKTSEGFEVVKEIYGNTIDSNLLYNEILSNVKNHEDTINVKEKGFYLEPSITSSSDELISKLNTLNSLESVSLTYDFGGFGKETLAYSQFSDWLDVNEEKEIIVSKEKAVEYIKSLAAKYDTVKKQRSFKTSHNTTISTGNGIYGYQTHIDKSAELLITTILAAKSSNINLIYRTEGYSRNTTVNDDIGDTYIEIDITTQQMWFYKKGELVVLTNIVTGLPQDGRDTPTGLFSVWSKERKRYLTGDDYKLWVEHWIPVNWGGIGIHDSSWQTVYGDEHYKTRGIGSHGCINTPFDNVQKIYKDVEINTPVIIYNS